MSICEWCTCFLTINMIFGCMFYLKMHNVYDIDTTVLYVFYRNAYRDARTARIVLAMYVLK